MSFLYSSLITAVFVFLGLWFYPKFMPEVMSEQMQNGKEVIVYFTVISAPVAGLVLGIALYTFLNRHKGDTPPPDGPAIRTNNPVVLVWTIVSSLFCLVAIAWGLVEMNVSSSEAADKAPNAIVVEVTGSQWVWNFNYPDYGFSSDKLNLPIDRPVVFRITSVDVNHSFWPVQLGVKVDANRHAVTTARTTPNVLGSIEIKCAELCGLYHAYMESEGEIMTESNFSSWVTAEGGHTA
jgi:cytochrome c oxidase subunit 2